MRHGEPDWGLVDGEAWRGAANDLAPLTSRGEEQAREAADLLRSDPPALVLASPMTRALQTAAIIAAALSVELKVDIDLREWLPDELYQWSSVSYVVSAHEEMLLNDGVRPSDSCRWEPLASVRSRATNVLEKYATNDVPVLVVCHEVLIHALTSEQRTEHGAMRTLQLGQRSSNDR
jgi:broad specificity phosphatase PhoE